MRNRKETAWKKSRKFGDVYGGRMSPKLADNIFNRAHTLQAPAPGADLPILIEDNPSRDFFFPISGAETLDALRRLPEDHTDSITHLWLRRVRKSDYLKSELPLAQFICGSGVRLIILYPWPTDLLLRVGKKKPTEAIQRSYKRWKPELVQVDGAWAFKWTEASLKAFYVEHLLYHEVGHHIDWYHRHWSKANRRGVEECANQYAMSMSATTTQVFDSAAALKTSATSQLA